MIEQAWIIAIIPLIAWFVIFLFAKGLKEKVAYVGILAMSLSLLLSLITFAQALGGSVEKSFPWAVVGKVTIPIGFQVDPLTAVMLLVITIVSLMVQIYSVGYMHGDVRYAKYYAIVSLFSAAMLGLVLANNFFWLVLSWEIMGLSSYLLISHWYEKPEAAAAGMKAFITTRIGDIGLLLGTILLFVWTGSFEFNVIAEKIHAGELSQGLVTAAALLVFAGGVGKSAQFPLHVWLPDAMAGPTPGSALIHAATMVAAGVYLVARAYGIFVATPYGLFWVALIGGFTALFAASIATVMTDIKKVLAYSTVSQLGYMMLGLGAGSYTAGVFHLMTHAFFKSLLFLASGSVIHAVHSQEMHEMGGLRKKLPITYWTFLIGTAALAGIPPFSGFWSKDEILLAAYRSPYPVLFWMGVATAGLTAYYMTRAVILTFFGQPRDHHKYEHAHESPPVMTVPLIILAILATVSGFPGSPFMNHAFAEFVKFGHGHEAEPSTFVMLLAIGAALLGVLVGVAIYGYGLISREKAIRSLRPLYLVLKNKYYVDEFYLAVFVRGTVLLAEVVGAFDKYVIDGIVNLVGWLGVQLSFLSGLFDKYVIDGLVNGVAALTMALGNGVRRLQTGYVQSYAITLFAGVVIGLILIQLIGG